jgi:hypothetical protein
VARRAVYLVGLFSLQESPVRFLALLATTLLLAACPKQADTVTVTGTADQQVDQYSSKLEELRTRMQAAEDQCPADACSLAKEGCTISDRICEIAAKNTDRTDFQERCGRSQEDCAQFNDTCARCK